VKKIRLNLMLIMILIKTAYKALLKASQVRKQTRPPYSSLEYVPKAFLNGATISVAELVLGLALVLSMFVLLLKRMPSARATTSEKRILLR
jgi:hypothetical protein